MSDADEIEKLAKLRDGGVLTQAEFDQKKAQILGRQQLPGPQNHRATPRRGLWWKVPVAIVILVVAANVIAGNRGAVQPATTLGTTPTATTSINSLQPVDRFQSMMPRDQANFVSINEAARTQYANGGNEMAKGAARPARARAICSAFPNHSVSGWIGKVYELSTNGDGKGVVELEIGRDIYVKTWNNDFSDLFDKTLIEPHSALFNVAVALKEGQLVRFGGTFSASQSDCFKEPSLSLAGSIRSPEFIFAFRSLEEAR